ncbi:hypothetical protein GGX14DRAFT_400303 [Mycena pura]|uniref:Uncharacterized protein n=1 Tax=Mycena pura TaxID=153505 RepID=A0AAD6YBQ6_9AGAR|nr:hypothetical protein GGX14DRAFT_400303 [Mycena pura]
MSTCTATQAAAALRVSAYAIGFFDRHRLALIVWKLFADVARRIPPVHTAEGISSTFPGVHFVHHVLLYLTSQIILALRTYAVSRRSPVVLRVLVVLYIIAAVPEFISSFWKRIRKVSILVCTSGNLPGVHLASLYYVGGLMSQLAKMMLQDGIMYFVALSTMNVVNIIFFNHGNPSVQSSASTLGFAVTMIFSSRFILNLSEHMRDGVSGDQSSSRTPVHHSSNHPGFRNANQLGSGTEPHRDIVVKVVKNVITMSDIGRDDDLESRTKSGNEQWEGVNMA